MGKGIFIGTQMNGIREPASQMPYSYHKFQGSMCFWNGRNFLWEGYIIIHLAKKSTVKYACNEHAFNENSSVKK